jgi:hypothetical protein
MKLMQEQVIRNYSVYQVDCHNVDEIQRQLDHLYMRNERHTTIDTKFGEPFAKYKINGHNDICFFVNSGYDNKTFFGGSIVVISDDDEIESFPTEESFYIMYKKHYLDLKERKQNG